MWLTVGLFNYFVVAIGISKSSAFPKQLKLDVYALISLNYELKC